jgi:hypothetical protein
VVQQTGEPWRFIATADWQLKAVRRASGLSCIHQGAIRTASFWYQNA